MTDDLPTGWYCFACGEVVPHYADRGGQRCAACVAGRRRARPTTEPDDADLLDVTYPCGWGGQPRCTVRLPRRGLCPEHKAVIATTMAATGKTATEGNRENGRTAYAARQAEEAQQRAEEKAAKVVTFVRAAENFPVQRKALAAALGDGAVLTRAIARVAEGDDVTWYRGRPAQTGFYLPGEEPQRRPDPLTPAQRERQRAAHRERRPTRAEVDEAGRAAGVLA